MADATGNISCPLCALSVTTKMMHNHMGAHILLEPSWVEKYGKERPALPCGICGIRDSVMCQSEIAAEQVPGCPVSAKLVRPPGGGPLTLKPNHPCKLLQGRCLDYSLSSRRNSAVSSPSTNRPVECPVCLPHVLLVIQHGGTCGSGCVRRSQGRCSSCVLHTQAPRARMARAIPHLHPFQAEALWARTGVPLPHTPCHRGREAEAGKPIAQLAAQPSSAMRAQPGGGGDGGTSVRLR